MHGRAVACQIASHRNVLRWRTARSTDLSKIRQIPSMSDQPSAAQQEAHLKVMRAIEANPTISQRELAKELGISLGKTNYCLKALLEKGWIKAMNFKNSNNKVAYSYLLTPKGADQKAKLAVSFLNRKRVEFEILEREIKQLSDELSKSI